MHDDQGWTDISTNPPQAGQYQVRVTGGDNYRYFGLRHWDGKQWLSRSGRTGTGFGKPSTLIAQHWRVPVKP